ncbi:uncharacterized protein LOC132928733 [Rhopalosiphum padi]|uniref:uncharacterized protein LOC132928733 n=1 Tax=Rhopalosiphum padi TaxID=40932 RepID=UPI00298E29D9|nr:uncharacterized protein LOC132928733 [Rhopalosiphum padi]
MTETYGYHDKARPLDDDDLGTASEFIWTNKRKLALLNMMIECAETYWLVLHMSMLLIQFHLSERLKTNVYTTVIWDYLNTY